MRSGCRPPCPGRWPPAPGPPARCCRAAGGRALRQFGLERVDELAARGGGRISRARAADEDDAGGEGVSADPDRPSSAFGPHRPGAADSEAGRITASRKVSQPVLAVPPLIAFGLRLLEGVVDGDREGRVRLLGEPVHGLRHAVEKEGLRFLLAAVAIGRGDQFLGLGHGERSEEIRENRLQRAAQPDVEEVRQVGVADVVVVGRVSGNTLCLTERTCVAASSLLR